MLEYHPRELYIFTQVHRDSTYAHQGLARQLPEQVKYIYQISNASHLIRHSVRGSHTFPWISCFMGPSSSAPSAISLVTVLFRSATVKDSIEEYPLFVAALLLTKAGLEI